MRLKDKFTVVPVIRKIDFGDGEKILVKFAGEEVTPAFWNNLLRLKEEKSLDSIASSDILGNLMVDYGVITGWEGITENGKEVLFTPENAKKLFTGCPRLANEVFTFAAKLSNFSKYTKEKLKKS